MKKIILALVAAAMIPQMTAAQDMESKMKQMTLREKIAQIVIVGVSSHGSATGHEADVKKMSELQLGGVIVDDDKLTTNLQLINELQNVSKVPLMVTIDGEWGASMRYREYTVFPRAMQLGALRKPDLVYKAGKAVGEELKELNILVNFAPDVDVNNNPSNPVIGVRSFGENKRKVAEYGSAFMLGMKDAGVAGSAKHFPGHGDTDVDSHKGLPVLQFERKRLERLELYPFRRLIADGVDMVMIGHLSVPALDATMTPASVSYPIVTKLLKNQMGYKGIVITDALEMKGIAGDGIDASLEAYKAGADILLMPLDAVQTIDTLEKAFKAGALDEKELDGKVLKMLDLKKRLGMFEDGYSKTVDTADIEKRTVRPETEKLIQEIADKSVTVLRKKGRLPYIKNWESTAYIAFNPSENSKYITDRLEEKGVKIFNIPEGASNEYIYNIRKEIFHKYKRVIIGFHSGSPVARTGGPRRMTKITPEQFQILSSIGVRHNAICLYFGIPYDFNNYERLRDFNCIVMGYEDTKFNNIAVRKLLFGEIKSEGELPVAVGKFKCGRSR